MELIKTISWSGVHISLNEWYTGKHWSKRVKQKNKWWALFTILMNGKKFKLDTYKLELVYNSRLDPSNTITMIKLFEDYLVKKKLIIDDNKKYCKGISLTPDESMKANHYKIKIYGKRLD